MNEDCDKFYDMLKTQTEHVSHFHSEISLSQHQILKAIRFAWIKIKMNA